MAAKAKNQNFYTDTLYGSEAPSGMLVLSSTSHLTKGVVQVVGTSLDLSIGGQVGRFVHANTALRTYTLPDVSGTLFSQGIFTGANQLLYSTGSGTSTTLASIASSVLTTDAGGVPTWVTGTNGQFLQILGGVVTFGALPASVGTIANALGNTLAVYQSPGPGNALLGLTTVNNRTLISPSGILTWGLLTAPYLSASGGVPLGNGVAGQKLWAVGDGTFLWQNDPAVVNPGTQLRLSYYSAPTLGTTLDSSGFMELDENTKTLKLLNYGKLRFYEDLVNGTNYIELRAGNAFGSPVIFTLPLADGANGSVLKTDGFGNLSFVTLNSGTVNNGAANQLAYYGASGNTISALTTTTARVLTSPLGTLTWNLISAPYLAALGNVPLGNGTLNQVLVSNADGTFNWVTASTLTGSVATGPAQAAAYYSASGSQVSPSSFINFIDSPKRLDLQDGATLRLYEPLGSGVNYVQFTAASSIPSSVSWVLPSADGTIGQVVKTDGAGNLSFVTIGSGSVNLGVANELAYYQAADENVYPLASTASRVLTTTAGNLLAWGLIKEGYLSASGNIPLSGGTAGQILVSDGFSNFGWAMPGSLTGTVANGTANFLAYYPATGTGVAGNSFLAIDDTLKEFHVTTHGTLQFFESTNSFSAGLRASNALAANVFWNLPLLDASASGQVLVSDASGNLSFVDQVFVGTVNALAFYSSATRQVQPTTNVTTTASGLTFTGLSYTLAGTPGGAPTAVSVQAGDGVGVNGADLSLYAGDTDVATAGSLRLGIGGNDLAVVETSYLSLQVNVALRFLDSLSGYVGFQAPLVTTNTIWTLPNADGTSNQALTTDGSGILSWQTVPVGISIATGTANTIAYYDTSTSISSTTLLVPLLAPGTNGVALISDTLGQLSYQMLVTPSGTAGRVAFYTSAQTVDSSASFIWDDGLKQLLLLSQGGITFFDASADTIVLTAPAVVSSYSLTLPAAAPLADQVLMATSPSDSTFEFPDNTPSRQKRGNVSIPLGVSSVSVVYAVPFASTPAVVLAQWSIEGVTPPASLPTYAISASSSTGFTITFSTTTTSTSYSMYWQSYLTSIL